MPVFDDNYKIIWIIYRVSFRLVGWADITSSNKMITCFSYLFFFSFHETTGNRFHESTTLYPMPYDVSWVQPCVLFHMTFRVYNSVSYSIWLFVGDFYLFTTLRVLEIFRIIQSHLIVSQLSNCGTDRIRAKWTSSKRVGGGGAQRLHAKWHPRHSPFHNDVIPTFICPPPPSQTEVIPKWSNWLLNNKKYCF